MSDPNPRAAGAARPLLCRLQYHRPADRWAFTDDSDPCRDVLQCRRCGHELRSVHRHEWGDKQPRTDNLHGPCGRRRTCLRCNADGLAFDHRMETYAGDELPYSPVPKSAVERGRCARITICTVCGEVERQDWAHKFPGGWHPCVRCDLPRHLDPDYGE